MRRGSARPALLLRLEQLHAFWMNRQGLRAAVQGGVADAVRASGWMNSAGGTGPYIAIRARLPGCPRSEVDRCVFEEGRLAEIPAVRACTMLVPEEDVPLALHCAFQAERKRFEVLRKKCDLGDSELENLADAVIQVLGGGALTPEALREKLPPQFVRPLGDAGRRLGYSSTLAVALRLLQNRGAVRRVAINKRLDANRYEYKLFLPNPHQAFPLPPNEDNIRRELARRFFHWAGPATLKEFAWWAGLSQRESKEATRDLDLVPVSVSGWTEESWCLEEDANALRSTRELGEQSICLLPVRDNYLYFRRGIAVFVREEDRGARIQDWRNRLAPIGDMDSLHAHAIILQGILVGLWDYDADRQRVVWGALGSLTAAQRRLVKAQIEALERVIQTELGDVAFYGLDHGRSRRERINAILGL